MPPCLAVTQRSQGTWLFHCSSSENTTPPQLGRLLRTARSIKRNRLCAVRASWVTSCNAQRRPLGLWVGHRARQLHPARRLLSRRAPDVCDASGALPAAPLRYTQHPASQPASQPPRSFRSRRPDGADILPARSLLSPPLALASLLRSKRETQLPTRLLASLLHSEARGHGYISLQPIRKHNPRPPNLDGSCSSGEGKVFPARKGFLQGQIYLLIGELQGLQMLF